MEQRDYMIEGPVGAREEGATMGDRLSAGGAGATGGGCIGPEDWRAVGNDNSDAFNVDRILWGQLKK